MNRYDKKLVICQDDYVSRSVIHDTDLKSGNLGLVRQ
jgi:hypothetical protein